MISLPAGSRIWLVTGVTDMRNGFNGLASRVQNVLNDDLFSGHLFIFRGRRGDMVKLLWSDEDGLCLFIKRLERGHFVWPAGVTCCNVGCMKNELPDGGRWQKKLSLLRL
ncbi:IS66 family insertion sequence hypothetical protein [Escherichia sp. E1130]|nr:IS66 family insertion sequence hypothetical protein [Escherichia sp. E1130]TLI62854.1 IS66 family insertion sequence element accessory protein TnpB [Escherichia sp. E1130]